jgi:ubiquinone biosynthesis protein COQ4
VYDEDEVMMDNLIHPDREKLGLRPVKALRHFRNLIADKEDTEQVFHIIESLNGKALLHGLERFSKTPQGKARIQERRFLPPMLDDHATLRKLPKDSLGRAYIEFMETEGLSAAGLVEEFDKFSEKTPRYGDLIEWYGCRLRDTHDLLHVLTGYGRDALGEVCVLGFSDGQMPGLGIKFIAYMGGREIRKVAPKGSPVLRAVREGQKLGKQAAQITQEDIPALLKEPISEVRKRLNIGEPHLYHKVHTLFRENGQDPATVMA